jgi:hypothetical protein
VVVLTIRWPSASEDATSNMLGELEQRLVILKFKLKKVSMRVEMNIQHDDSNEFIRINSIPYLSVDCCVS